MTPTCARILPGESAHEYRYCGRPAEYEQGFGSVSRLLCAECVAELGAPVAGEMRRLVEA